MSPCNDYHQPLVPYWSIVPPTLPAWTDYGETTAADSVTLSRCAYCEGYHDGTCDRVKAIEYHPCGAIKRVELK